jgi:glutathione gamma-glutamylcysteinyltransferase
MDTLYRRPLPTDAVAFSSSEGRAIFAEALAAGGLDGYFPLAEQFHTQSDPSFCGLGSLVVALNALGIDPGRLWKGPWRWFAEDLLDCCVPLPEVRKRGLDIDELSCLARCNGAEVEVRRADEQNLDAWREAIASSSRGLAVVIAAYDRGAMAQTGGGHYSPIGGYHAARDLALVLDVARFKYPPHWVPADQLWHAMHPIDAATGRSRGWLVLRRRERGLALGFTLRCDGDGWQGLADRFTSAVGSLREGSSLEDLARAILPLIDHLELRDPHETAHRDALAATRASLRALRGYPVIVNAIGELRAEGVALLLLALGGSLSPIQRAALGEVAPTTMEDSWLAEELRNLREQLSAVARAGTCVGPTSMKA